MFSGIIQTCGKISILIKSNDFLSIEIQSNLKGNKFTADISKETLEKTNAKFWRKGTILNLENSLKIGDEVSGHFVFGHVDTTGKLLDVKQFGKSWSLLIEFPTSIKKYIAQKGSISLNGISLTINNMKSNTFL